MKRKICFATGTRAEYGLLSQLMKTISNDPELELQIIATNMHLSPEYGLTYKEIEKDGFSINQKVEMLVSGNTDSAVAKSLGLGIIGFTDALVMLKPDILVILGDRYEMLGMASTALLLKIPIAHISGGDVTEGAYDDAIRHSITKMSSLHFTSTETYRNRVIQLGEQPERVYNFGSIGLDNIKRMKLLSQTEFEESIGFKLGEKNALVTFHPATAEKHSPSQQINNLLSALDRFKGNIIFTRPNSDAGSKTISEAIDKFVEQHKETSCVFSSLGYLRYLSALRFVDVVIGNSSSGIVEVPSFHIPTINIGTRQKGRIKAKSVIDCSTEESDIVKTLETVLSPEFFNTIKNIPNPYEKENTVENIKQTLKTVSLENLYQKRFYDIV